MWLHDFYQQNGQQFSFTREQASRFAKQVADDFNPIHDVDAKRFCVPGDLLFALSLSRAGIRQEMDFSFADMVTDGVPLHFAGEGDSLRLVDESDKTFMSLAASGAANTDAALVEQLTRAYVAFSGHTFPHILVPLWREQNVMINPARPMVIYQSMHLSFNTLALESLSLDAAGASMTVDGKRGQVVVRFAFKDGDKVVGKGEKKLVLSGLREFDEDAVAGVVEYYDERKARLK
ncbi:DUF3581 domain-containing protein [Simiduia agarivorans]|uniref:DUF3581 domain-containing protein n=1 Tax=Simiduia agarivorans (strain DSM 21679 / JCM 13881 / BCRC 17597 / SA1) TaxID=1117647 RepID=K4KWT6_SIMAS|nr:DUF3581 domain-containing protein [Simiduia agarivorans]AFU98407.1 hypothetical protein M5M_06050 [Simiduia agarivorans SA1 = DSM 21679]